MRIESIKISNYRQYKNIDFDFSKKTSHDMHIIIASNGVGKTNFLNAVTWCLYNDESHLGIKSRALPILNIDIIESLKNGEQAKVCVEIMFNVDGTKYIANRTLMCTKNDKIPNKIYMSQSKYELSILKSNVNELPAILYDMEALNYLNRYLPKSINEYFFFDNEQLDQYFIHNESETIKTAVKELSQVELLARSLRHLNEIMKEYQSIVKRNNPDLDSLEREMNLAIESKNIFEENIDRYKKQINISKTKIQENKQILKGAPNIKKIEEEIEKLEFRIEKLKAQSKDQLDDLHTFIKEYNIVLRMYPELTKTLDIIKEQEDSGNLPIEINVDILKNMLKNEECKFCGRSLTLEGKENIQEMIKKIQYSSETSSLLMKITSEIQRMINKAENYPKIKEKLWKNYNETTSSLGELQVEKQLKKELITQRSDSDALKNLIIENERHQSILESNKEKLILDNKRLEGAINKVIEATDKYHKALDKSNKNLETKILLQFSKKAYDIIEESYNELVNEMKVAITEKTYHIFSNLIWKENTYKEVTINDNYNIDLIHNMGYSCIGSCSAAERALLALSFTLALHKVSGFNAPLVIDSPVGRVSDINRENFGKVLTDVSGSKQIIMLFTPSEYSDEIAPLFKENCSNIFKISTLDEITSSKIGGYDYE